MYVFAFKTGRISCQYSRDLPTYYRYFYFSGIETKLRDICDEFLGPVYKSKTNTWLPQVLVSLHFLPHLVKVPYISRCHDICVHTTSVDVRTASIVLHTTVLIQAFILLVRPFALLASIVLHTTSSDVGTTSIVFNFFILLVQVSILPIWTSILLHTTGTGSMSIRTDTVVIVSGNFPKVVVHFVLRSRESSRIFNLN